MGLSYARNAGAARGARRNLRLHGQRLHGRSGLAVLHGRHAAQRRLRGRRRTEYLAAGGELDSGRGRRRAGRAEPRAAHRRRGRAHPRLQHGLSSRGLRERRRLRHRVSQGRRRRGLLLAAADATAASSPSRPARSSGTTGVSRSTRFASSRKATAKRSAMLRFKHLIFFGPTGTAKWKGQIYGAPRFNWLFNKPVIYHGVFGHGLFQSDLSRAAERARGVSQQHRMGRAHRVHRGARLAAREAAHGAAGSCFSAPSSSR